MTGWTPARPERPAPAAPHGAALGTPTAIAGLPVAPVGERRVPAPVASRRRRRRLRLSPAKRLIAGFALLALVIGAVTGVGTALTPSYGDLAPWRDAAIADVRQSPEPTGWTTNLSRAMLPGVPSRCAEFRASSATDPLVMITADSPSLGSTANCSVSTIQQVDATVALFDPVTGDVRWRHDLSREFPATTGTFTVQQTWIRADVGRVLVAFTTDGRFTLAVLSLGDGTLLSSIQVPRGDIGSGPLVEGSLVAYSVSTSREGSSLWTLTDIRTLGDPVWTDLLPDSTPVVLLRSGLFTEVDGRSVRIDGATGEANQVGDGTVGFGSVEEDGVDLFTSDTLASGVAITAWSPEGRRLWTRGGLGDFAGLSRSCLLTSLPGTTSLRCVDRATGASRWTRDLASQGSPTGMVGQTTDDVAVFRSFGNHSELVMLAGGSGRPKFSVDLLPTTTIAAVSRTTGYLVSSSLSGTPIGLIAFDTESGRILWQRNVLDDGDTEMWGGRLVELSSDGIVRELTNPPGTVLGT